MSAEIVSASSKGERRRPGRPKGSGRKQLLLRQVELDATFEATKEYCGLASEPLLPDGDTLFKRIRVLEHILLRVMRRAEIVNDHHVVLSATRELRAVTELLARTIAGEFDRPAQSTVGHRVLLLHPVGGATQGDAVAIGGHGSGLPAEPTAGGTSDEGALDRQGHR